MARLIYSFFVSLDGYIAGPGGDIGWGTPDEVIHRAANEEARASSAFLYGRRLYDVMRYWQDDDPQWRDFEREFAAIWREKPKIVFSSTLQSVGPNCRLVAGDAVEEVRRLKAEYGEGEISVGGAALAQSLMKAGLVDEYRVYFNPVLIGGGTPMFPHDGQRVPLKLIESRTFDSGVVMASYDTLRE